MNFLGRAGLAVVGGIVTGPVVAHLACEDTFTEGAKKIIYLRPFPKDKADRIAMAVVAAISAIAIACLGLFSGVVAMSVLGIGLRSFLDKEEPSLMKRVSSHGFYPFTVALVALRLASFAVL